MSKIQIGDRPVGPDEPTFVIAEAGSNHNGDLETAKRLIDVAADAGVDAVKFQTFRADRLYVEDSGEVDYLDDDRTIYEVIEEMEMPYDWIPDLANYCRGRDVQFMSTPFDERSADRLEDYVPAYKVASYTMSHHPFLKHLGQKDKPVVMSTGAHGMEEVEEAVSVLRSTGVEFGLFQCVAAYPTPLESINVRVVATLRDRFGVPVGLSDHTLDPVTAPTAAVALGANMIEKHFTLDRSMEGPDHEFALEPDELDSMVTAIRQTERALGSGEKRILDVERELHDVARRRIHATRDIPAGDRIEESDVAILRSGEQTNGLDPKFYDEVIGMQTVRDVAEEEGITWNDLDTT